VCSFVLRFYLKEFELTVEGMSERLEVSARTAGDWTTGRRMPGYEAVWALAELFGVSMDVLLGLAFPVRLAYALLDAELLKRLD
jgi:transcriptional regulator with XRE-family HTH domain